MQNRKELVEKAIKEFILDNCKVLQKSDMQILVKMFKDNLKNYNYKYLKIIYNLIMALELDKQTKCFKYRTIELFETKDEDFDMVWNMPKQFEAEELGDARYSKDYNEYFSGFYEDEFSKTDTSINLTKFVVQSNYLIKAIKEEQDEFLIELYKDNFPNQYRDMSVLHDDILDEYYELSNVNLDFLFKFIDKEEVEYLYLDKILRYFLEKRKYNKILKLLTYLYYHSRKKVTGKLKWSDIDPEVSVKLPLYECFRDIYSTHDTKLISKLCLISLYFCDEIMLYESPKHVDEILSIYESCSDSTIYKIVYQIYQSSTFDMHESIGSYIRYSTFMTNLIKRIIINNPKQVINGFEKLLSNEHIKAHLDRDSSLEETEHTLLSIIKTLPIVISDIQEEKIGILLPLFDVMYKIPKFILRYHKNELKQDEKDTWALEAIQEISIVNDMLKNIKKLYESHSIKVAKHRILITVLEKLAGLKPLTPSSSLEIFPISYLINSLQSKDNHVSDSLFEILLLLFKDMNFNNEEDKKYLTKLLNIFFDYDKVDYVTKALRRLIVSIKPWVDKNIKRYNRDTTLFFILDYLFNRTIDENTSSSMQLENYVNILFDALDDRKHDELYEKNGLNEILVFEIISLNLKRVIEHSSIKNIIKLFPVIKLIRDTLEELVSENYLKAEYKEDELQNQIGINQFISSSFDIVLAHFNDIDCLKEPTEYFREDEWNLHKDIINKCYRKYQMKVLTGKVAGYLNFISRYLESSINTEDELINKKAKILANIVHVLNTKLRAYNEAKKNEEAKVEEQKKMLSFLTHTLRNSLSAGPEIAKSITGNLKFLLGDSYLENNTAYKTINNATSLLTTFKYVDNLIETFKLFSSNKSAITKKLENENDGDLLIGNLVNQVLNQTISKYLFYDSYLSERKQLFDSKNIKSIKESFLEQVLLNTETDNHADIVLSWLNNNSTIIQAGPYKTEFKIKNNGIRFGILFSIFSELISNSFSYFDGIGKIKIDLNESEKFIEFTCRDHYNENLNIIKGTNKGIYFIKHIVSLVNEISFEVSQQNGVWISIIRIKK